MKKTAKIIIIISVWVFVLLCVGSAEEIKKTGSCGNNIQWTLYDNGTLVISGNGDMEDSPFYGNTGTNYDFSYDSVKKVIIEDGISGIGEMAFAYCRELVEISIPETVTYIDKYAFYYCENISVIHIPENVKSIKICAFYGCDSLEECIVDNKNDYYCSDNGIIFDKNMSTIVYYPAGKQGQSFTIPLGINSVGEHAFIYNRNIETLIIPESVTEICGGSFLDSQNLKKIHVPKSVEYIGGFAFSGCENLKDLIIDEGVQGIKSFAFRGCSNIEEIVIPSSVNKMGYCPFCGCTNLKKVCFKSNKIPDMHSFETEICNFVYGHLAWLKGGTVANVIHHEDIHYNLYYPSDWEWENSSSVGSTTGVSSDVFSHLYDETTKINLCGYYTLIPIEKPVIMQNPISNSVIYGSKAYFDVVSDGTELDYQWQVSTDGGSTWKNSSLSGNKSDRLSVVATSSRNGYLFRCIVTDCVGQSAISSAAMLEVSKGDISVVSQPKSININENQTATFRISAKSASNSTLNYQWQVSTNGGKSWKNSGLTGNNTANLKVVAGLTRNGYLFRCVITSANGESVISSIVKLTVKQVIRIDSQPLNQTVTNTSNIKIRVSATSFINSELSYQWQVSTDSGCTWNNSSLAGNKTSVLTVGYALSRSGYRFRCVISDLDGNTVTTSPMILTIKSTSSGGIITLKHITVGQNVIMGKTVIYSVLASSNTGLQVSYQWQTSKDGGKNWSNSMLSGCKTATLKVEATNSRNDYQFRCIVTDSNGNKVISDAMKLTVKAV